MLNPQPLGLAACRMYEVYQAFQEPTGNKDILSWVSCIMLYHNRNPKTKDKRDSDEDPSPEFEGRVLGFSFAQILCEVDDRRRTWR